MVVKRVNQDMHLELRSTAFRNIGFHKCPRMVSVIISTFFKVGESTGTQLTAFFGTFLVRRPLFFLAKGPAPIPFLLRQRRIPGPWTGGRQLDCICFRVSQGIAQIMESIRSQPQRPSEVTDIFLIGFCVNVEDRPRQSTGLII